MNEQEILVKYKLTGETKLIGDLYKVHAHAIYGLCLYYLKNTALAEDAMMDIFESLFAKLLKHDVKSFRPWVMRLTRNFCLNNIKRQLAKNNFIELNEISYGFMETNDNLAHINESKLVNLEKALDELSQEQKLCIQGFFYHNLSYHDIADSTGFTMNQVKSYLQNAREKLQRQLAKTS